MPLPQDERMNEWLARNVAWVLMAAGVVMVAIGGFFVDQAAPAAALAVMGAGGFFLGALINRAEGQLELGPAGLKILLTKVVQKADQRRLPPAARNKAIDEVVTLWMVSHPHVQQPGLLEALGLQAWRELSARGRVLEKSGTISAGTTVSADTVIEALAEEVVRRAAEEAKPDDGASAG